MYYHLRPPRSPPRAPPLKVNSTTPIADNYPFDRSQPPSSWPPAYYSTCNPALKRSSGLPFCGSFSNPCFPTCFVLSWRGVTSRTTGPPSAKLGEVITSGRWSACSTSIFKAKVVCARRGRAGGRAPTQTHVGECGDIAGKSPL
jgi:hypothetical protein